MHEGAPAPRMDRRKWGLAGLLAFEAVIASFLFANDGTWWPYALGALTLAFALATGPTRWHFAALAFASAARAYLQTAGGAQLGVYPTWLVPLGFAWLALAPDTMPRAAIAGIAVARTWFVLWYALPGLWIVVAANVLGAAGAWLWAADTQVPAESVASDEAGPAA